MMSNEDLNKLLDQQTKQIKFLKKQVTDYSKVEDIIVAAGLLTREKFREARSILEDSQT
jgi:hypothetical protein